LSIKIIIYLYYINIISGKDDKIVSFLMGIGDWGLGNGDWGLGPKPPTPNPKTQTPKPHPQKKNKKFL